MRASNGRVDPRSTSMDKAATTSAARASRSAATSARASTAVDACVPLMSARPSFGASRTGASPARASASAPDRRPEAVCTSPSPMRTSARWASGARSPLAPTDPRLGTTGWTAALSIAMSRSSVSSRMPEWPRASTLARSAIIARTTGTGRRSPTPAAWLRSRLICSASSASGAMRTSANDPNPVLMP